MIQDCINAKNFNEFTREFKSQHLRHLNAMKNTDYEFVRFGLTSNCEIWTSTASPAQWLRHSLKQETAVAKPGILIGGGGGGRPNFIVRAAKKTLHKIISYHQGRWKVGVKLPLYLFSPPHRNFEPPFSLSFPKLFTIAHPIALQQWLIASLVIRFFSSLIPSSQRTGRPW